MTERDKIIAAADLVAKWRDRCLALAKQGKYWEAASLNDAANEMCAVLGPNPYSDPAPKPLTTDDAIRDAYERVKRQVPGPLPPAHWLPQPTRLYQPVPGIYPSTRVTD